MSGRRGRVAMLSEHASPIALLGSEDAGGQNVYVDQVSRNVASLGFQVDVFVRRDSDQPADEVEWAPGVRVVHLRAGPAAFVKKDPMWRHMPRFRDELVRYARSSPEPYDLIHANFWMSGWVACQAKPVLRVPVVEIFHALGKVKRQHQGEADTSPADRIPVEHEIVDRADRIIAQCPNDVDELVELYGADASRIEVIPSAVDVETFRPIPKDRARADLGLNPDEWVAVYVGRMLPRKGIDNVLEAFARLAKRLDRPMRLLLVGGESVDGDPMQTPEIRRLADMAALLKVRHLVTFAGKRPQSDLKGYYSAADLAVTTPWYEPYGLTPLEAMACGTPVIGSAVGGIKFTVADGETGFLVPPRDPQALAERMARLVVDREMARRMGSAARERVVRQFTWQKVGERTAELYERVLWDHRNGKLLVPTGAVVPFRDREDREDRDVEPARRSRAAG